MKDKSEKKPHKPKVRFIVDRKSRFVHDAVMFMLLSAIFRIVGCWGLWNDRFFAITQILLPIACNLLFILCLRVLGDKAFPTTILPVLLGVAFFIIRALGFDSILHTVLCIVLYVAVAVLYTLTALGIIRTKWLLVPLFGLPFIYHVAVEDLAALRDTANPVLFSDGMQELSVLAIMLAMVFTALAMKKGKPALEDVNLPKIKDPVIKAPSKPVQSTQSVQDTQPAQNTQSPAAEPPSAVYEAETETEAQPLPADCESENTQTKEENASDLNSSDLES